MKDIKIAIDARMINMSGIGSYTKLLMNNGIYEVALGNPEEIHAVEQGIDVIDFEEKIYGLKEQLRFPYAELRKRNVDMLHIPHYNVPFFYRGDFAVTVHDLIHLVLPEFLPNKLAYLYAKIIIGHAVRKAKIVFTDSINSKNDILKFFKVNPDKIVVAYLAVDKAYVHKEYEDVMYLKDKYSIPADKKVVMYVGNLKPHKNLIRLLNAYSKMENLQDTRLVLVGKAFDNTELDKTITDLGLSDKVIKTGIVSKEELVDFYNLADLFAFPSLYEGFGIPPLEAMACGTPVICSNTSSLPEVVGDAAYCFDPYDEAAITEALYKGLYDAKLREDLIIKGSTRVKLFENSEVLSKSMAAFEKIKG